MNEAADVENAARVMGRNAMRMFELETASMVREGQYDSRGNAEFVPLATASFSLAKNTGRKQHRCHVHYE